MAARVTFLDRAVGYFSPSRGIRRVVDRVRLTRAYEAAAPRDPWKPRRAGASANADHQADAATLRAKSRSIKQNVPYINAGMRARVQYAVGTGIAPTFSGPQADKKNEFWKKWAPVADADGAGDIYSLQARAMDTMDTDGEVLIRIRPRLPSDALPVPFQLQLLEVDWLDNTRTRGNGNNTVVNGVEYDQLGRKTGAWLWDQHPGDNTLQRSMRTQSHFVDAKYLIHLYDPTRPGAGRGFPRMVSVINWVRDLQLLLDGELSRKNLESRLSVLISGDATLLSNEDDSYDGVSEAKSLGDLASGGITQIPTGSNITTVEPKAAPGFTDYVKQLLHLIASGAGFTYEQGTGDMREANFTQSRMRMLHFRREIEQLQWLVLIPVLCQRICQEFANYGAMANLWTDTTAEVEHSTPKWEYVQPDTEVAAELKELSGGLTSFSALIRARGNDPEKVMDQMEKDVKEFKRRGLWDYLMFLQRGNLPTAPGNEGAAKP